jgi:hypothetical protein
VARTRLRGGLFSFYDLVLSREQTSERSFDELWMRSETGPTLTGRTNGAGVAAERERAPA